ncbi:MAG: 2-hydroxyglutaryl-CoA dehydratase [Clostridiales bacterium GWF2_38_85]|nr:MAG: 2-hydroxyglutaryl-CoA dehydratase [Clostridiales bacterium GWF2_38_85]HBL84834.1 2-hydroxyglutaryl-CoA dehydratase [Clostridiales bacterium]
MDNNYYVPFTKAMKKTHTILAPNMLPMHFKLILQVMRNYGYNVELLENQGQHIPELGLKYVHNDTCYPAILVIGQFIDALQSGKYDPHKVALIMFQTGGGCRASNYISLIRKALHKAGLGFIPVISFSLTGIERHPGWKLNLPILHRMFYGVMFADLLMLLANQCRPYEIEQGQSDKIAEEFVVELTDEMAKIRVLSYKKIRENYKQIIKKFSDIPRMHEEKIKVGIVGEIFIKYSPLGNNNLEKFLFKEGAEVTVPGFLDFCLYSVYNYIIDYKLYGLRKATFRLDKLLYNFLIKKQQKIIDLIKKHSDFTPPTPFKHVISLRNGYIGIGAKMGEGWLLTAEMLELYEQGVKNIICTQPFGCLPNHICGKGMMKPIKAHKPDINIVAIDYDASATQVNQENRIKLMLSNAKSRIETKSTEATIEYSIPL